MTSMENSTKGFKVILGGLLREERQRSGLTLDGALQATDLGVSKSALSAIERGDQQVSGKQLYELWQAYGSSIDSLFQKVREKTTLNKFKKIQIRPKKKGGKDEEWVSMFNL